MARFELVQIVAKANRDLTSHTNLPVSKNL